MPGIRRGSEETYRFHQTSTERPVTMEKVNILFLAADPFKQDALGLDEEIRAITNKILMAEDRDKLDLVSAWAVQPDDLQQLLLRHRPHIVHFSGHGSRAEQLILMDKNRQPSPV